MIRSFEGPQEAAVTKHAGSQRAIKDQTTVMNLLGGDLFAAYVREGQDAWGAEKLPKIYLTFSEDGMAKVHIYEFEPTLSQETIDTENDPRYKSRALTTHESDKLYPKAMEAMGWTA